MIKIFLLVFVFLIAPVKSPSQQSDWFLSYYKSFSGSAQEQVTSDSFDNIYTIQVYWQGATGQYLTKYSSDGNIIWNHGFKAQLIRAEPDQQGNLLLIGCFIDSLNLGGIVLNDTVSYGTLFYAKFDPSGNCLWGFKLPHRVYVHDILPLKDGGFYLSGNTFLISAKLGDDIISPGNDFIARFNSLGDCIETAVIGNVKSQLFLKADLQGNFIVAGNLWQSGLIGNANFSISVSNNSNDNTLVAKFDSSFKVIWAKVGKSHNSKTNGLAIDENGNVYVSGTMGSYISFDSQLFSAGGENMFLTKLNPDGQVLWLTGSMGADGSNTLISGNGLAIDQNGNPYVTGGIWTQDAVIGSYNISQDFSPYLVKFDTLGNVIWGMGPELTDSISGEGYSINIGSKGEIFLAGNYGGDFGNTLLTKITEQTVTTTVLKVRERNLLVFPNPSGGIFTIVYQSPIFDKLSLTIKNVLGQSVFNKTYESFNGSLNETIDLSKQGKGIYFINITVGESEETRKIIVQ
jgi:hypothetical protein